MLDDWSFDGWGGWEGGDGECKFGNIILFLYYLPRPVYVRCERSEVQSFMFIRISRLYIVCRVSETSSRS